MLRESRRREWREELRTAALEAKAAKERIAVLERRLESQRQSFQETAQRDREAHEALLLKVHDLLVEREQTRLKGIAEFAELQRKYRDLLATVEGSKTS